MLLVKNHLESRLLERTRWWIFARVLSQDESIIVGLIYIPPGKGHESYAAIVELLAGSIENIVEQFGEDPLVLGGDFNARLGKCSDFIPEELLQDTVIASDRDSCDAVKDREGVVLMDGMNANCLFVLNGRCRSDIPGQLTHSNYAGASTIDFVWSNVIGLSMVCDFFVLDEVFASDHFPLFVSLYIPGFKPDSELTETVALLDIEKCKWNPDHEAEFFSLIGQKFANIPPELTIDRECLNNFIVNSITDCARKLGMISRAKNTGNTIGGSTIPEFKKWSDREARALKSEVNRAWKKFKQNRVNNDKEADTGLLEEFHLKKKMFKDAVIKKKKMYYNDLSTRIANVNNMRDFWLTVKEVGKRYAGQMIISRESWELFYSNVYPPRIPCELDMLDARHPMLDAKISLSELEAVIESAKRNKAPGPDLISNEFWKALPHAGRALLLDLFNNVFDSGRVPESWPCAALSMIHKKGPKDDPANYRGIALTNSILKLFTKILARRIERWMESIGILPESQAGFRLGRCCEDQIFTLLTAIQMHLRFSESTVYAIFIDFQRAFDSVPHGLLWSKLFELGLSSKILRVLMDIYNNASAYVRLGAEDSGRFDITEGVLQGEILSPILFILFVSDFEKYFRDRNFRGISIDGHTDLLIPTFADDSVLLCHSIVDVQRKLRALEDYCSLNGLTVNTSKTKVLPFRESGRLRKIEINTFWYKGKLVETVKQYLYLGILLESNLKGVQTVISASQKARIAIGATKTILIKTRSKAWCTKLKLFNSVVSPTLLYAVASWGVGHYHMIEKIQDVYFKQLLLAPPNTPGYALRLELGLNNLATRALSLTINFIARVLSMSEVRLPRVCWNRLVFLLDKETNKVEFNWLSKIKLMLDEINMGGLCSVSDPRVWLESKPEILLRFQNNLKAIDLRRYEESHSLQLKIPRFFAMGTARYILLHCPIEFTRIVAQIRLANCYRTSFFIKGKIFKLNPRDYCKICHFELETVEHVICRCPCYHNVRLSFFNELFDLNDTERLLIILDIKNPKQLKCLALFMIEALLLREKLLSME